MSMHKVSQNNKVINMNGAVGCILTRVFICFPFLVAGVPGWANLQDFTGSAHVAG